MRYFNTQHHKFNGCWMRRVLVKTIIMYIMVYYPPLSIRIYVSSDNMCLIFFMVIYTQCCYTIWDILDPTFYSYLFFFICPVDIFFYLEGTLTSSFSRW